MGKLHDFMESNNAVYLLIHILHLHCKLIFGCEDILNPLAGEFVK